jgi:hypothetical protein
MGELRHDSNQKMIQDIVGLYKGGFLNLSPGFQRESVWTNADRAKLIDSIYRNYPLPAIFLRRRQENGGVIIYDVIDGKQRIETALMFMGIIRGNRFAATLQLEPEATPERYDWRGLARKNQQGRLLGYNFRTIEIDGDELSDIIDLFVRLNSTGKALTSAEKRNARYYDSDFLKAAAKLSDKFLDYFLKNKILSRVQITRMKHVELMCELMASVQKGDVINRKAALDQIMKKDSGISRAQTKKVARRTVTILNRIRQVFPKLNESRFRQLSDFYSLCVLFSKFESEKLILTDRHRNRLAQDLLLVFSNSVDGLKVRQKKAEGAKPGEEIYRQYLLTVLEGTDQVSQRQKRELILRGLLQGLFERKDSRRGFSEEQRRILWNSSATRKCTYRGCGTLLTWSDFTIDHIKPYSKGGRAEISNAALMCRKHNAKKGNRA